MYWFAPQILQQLEQILELHLGLPLGWQRTKVVGSSFVAILETLTKKLDCRQSGWGSNWHPTVKCRCPKYLFNPLGHNTHPTTKSSEQEQDMSKAILL